MKMMKFVQTYWSLPSRSRTTDSLDRHNGGWPGEKSHAVSWAFSLLSIKRQYPGEKITLYTDKAGAQWMIDKLHLPYDEVREELDVLNHYSPVFWALSKIYTYSRQKEPFLHIDGDVYIWKPFDRNVLNKELIAQSFEVGDRYYLDLINEARANLSGLPEFIANQWDATEVVACNSGILGANDIDFIGHYCKAAFDFVDRNESAMLASNYGGGYNVFFEQLFFSQLALERYKTLENVGVILEPQKSGFYDLTKFGLVPGLCQYIHMVGESKTKLDLISHLEHRFAYEFPEAARQINQTFTEPSRFYISRALWKQGPAITSGNDRKTEYHQCRDLYEEMHPGVRSANEDEIVSALQEHFDKPAFFRLWDLYQIESCGVLLDNHAKFQTRKDWTFLYNLTKEEFLRISFALNPDMCSILHCYYQWEFKYNPKKRRMEALPVEGQAELSAGVLPTPKLMCMTSDGFKLDDIRGWFSIFLRFEDHPVTGEQIMDNLRADQGISVDENELAANIYFFLSTQYYIYNRILPFIRDGLSAM